jgi:hypothetical protein
LTSRSSKSPSVRPAAGTGRSAIIGYKKSTIVDDSPLYWMMVNCQGMDWAWEAAFVLSTCGKGMKKGYPSSQTTESIRSGGDRTGLRITILPRLLMGISSRLCSVTFVF